MFSKFRKDCKLKSIQKWPDYFPTVNTIQSDIREVVLLLCLQELLKYKKSNSFIEIRNKITSTEKIYSSPTRVVRVRFPRDADKNCPLYLLIKSPLKNCFRSPHMEFQQNKSNFKNIRHLGEK